MMAAQWTFRALAVFGLLGSAAAFGDEPWIDSPFSAEPRAVAEAAREVPVPRSTSAVVLYRDASYEFDAEGRATYRHHLLYRLLTPQAVEDWSRIKVDYAPWHQARPEIRARVVTADGSEHWIDASDVVERPAASDAPDVVVDRRRLEVLLPALRVGAVVEEEVVVRDVEPFFVAGTAGSYVLRLLAPIHRGRLRLAAPVTLPLRYGVRLLDGLKPRQRLAGDRVELTFEYHRIPAAQSVEPGLPSHMPRLPQIVFSTGESWQAVAAGYARLVDEKIAGSDLAALADRLPPRPVSSGRTRQRIAEVLGELHREVRYSGLELGASSVVPAAPDLTLERRFGDCKDQATLLVALLQRDGIPAHVALLNAGFGHDVESKLPGLGRFNHAVVYVPTSPPIWIDPTDPAARAGELPAADRNRWALVADPETRKLLRTPTTNSIDNLTVEHREVHLADHGPGRVVETSVYHGEQERQQRRVASASTDESRREGYRSYVESTYLAEELGEIEESDPEDVSQPFTLKLEALGSSRAMTDLSECVMAIRQETLVASLPMALQKGDRPRQAPFVIEQPFITEWHYRIVPPAGFVPRELAENEERRLGSARYTRSLRQEDGAVMVDLRFDSGPRHLTAAQFEEMRGAVRAFLDQEPLLLWFDHVGAAALTAGKGLEAIGHFRRLAETEPDRAIHRVRLAQALLRVGLGRESKRQARLAVELEPASALALWSLGFALEHDELGRRFSPGFDRPTALETLERAIEIDPDNPLPRTELAILLEYDDQGRRYTAGADLGRAIAEYRILTDELGARNLEVNLISALYWARRWEELYSTTLRHHDSPVSRYLHLVALAILQGPDAAIRESRNLSSTAEEQVSLLNSAAQHLVIARRYPAASALLKRAARDAANATGLVNRAEVLARARRHEELEIKTGTPADLAKSLLQVLGQPGLDRDRLTELFHPHYLADRGTQESALEATFKRLRQEQFKSVGDLPVEAVLDLALVILDAGIDGDPERGFRVRLLNQMAGRKVAFRVYVTPFEGRLVIAAIEDEHGQIAKEVWRRLDRGDLRGAHQWLDWARDTQAPAPTDDPYGFRPFAHFWTRGTGAFQEKMRLGAAILMADQPEAEEALPLLEEALRTADDETRRRILETAVFSAYSRLGRDEQLGALSAQLLEREPTSALAFLGRCQLLLRTGRLDELERLAEARLDLLPGDPDALRYLVRSAARRSDPDRAIAYFEELRDAGKLSPGDDNLWSWLLLFRDPVPEKALAVAERGALASQFRDRPMLHTLSAVYAELGRPAEAYQVFLQSLELREEPQPQGDDWYVFGRIVEEYGFSELAREYYGRVDAPRAGEVYTAFDLAGKRLRLASEDGKKRRGS